MSGRHTANAALTRPRIATLTSTILRVRRGSADGDALWFMPPLETDGRCGGVCNFGYVRDTRNPRRRRPASLPQPGRPATHTAPGRIASKQYFEIAVADKLVVLVDDPFVDEADRCQLRLAGDPYHDLGKPRGGLEFDAHDWLAAIRLDRARVPAHLKPRPGLDAGRDRRGQHLQRKRHAHNDRTPLPGSPTNVCICLICCAARGRLLPLTIRAGPLVIPAGLPS